MNLGTEVDVASRQIPVTGKTLGHSFFLAQLCREIIRADLDIAHPYRLTMGDEWKSR
jgi:hypothetical protein